MDVVYVDKASTIFDDSAVDLTLLYCNFVFVYSSKNSTTMYEKDLINTNTKGYTYIYIYICIHHIGWLLVVITNSEPRRKNIHREEIRLQRKIGPRETSIEGGRAQG